MVKIPDFSKARWGWSLHLKLGMGMATILLMINSGQKGFRNSRFQDLLVQFMRAATLSVDRWVGTWFIYSSILKLSTHLSLQTFIDLPFPSDQKVASLRKLESL